MNDVIQEEQHDHCWLSAVINQDLLALKDWADDNKTTFEPEKMSAMVVTQRRSDPFDIDAAGIIFDGEELSIVDETTLVGLKIDGKMKWGPIVKKLATKARQRLGALSRVRHLLDNDNLKTIYLMFIRSIMEHNSTCWMGAAHLTLLNSTESKHPLKSSDASLLNLSSLAEKQLLYPSLSRC